VSFPVQFWIDALDLRNHTGLELNLSSYAIGEAGARAIAEQLPHLTWLNLPSNQIGEAVQAELREMLSGRMKKLYL